MNIKFRNGSAVTELTQIKGEWNIKRNGVNLDVKKLEKIIKIMEEKENE